ncbi:hypothetical protein MHYP_G00251150 [Metynnis hypsauchen]
MVAGSEWWCEGGVKEQLVDVRERSEVAQDCRVAGSNFAVAEIDATPDVEKRSLSGRRRKKQLRDNIQTEKRMCDCMAGVGEKAMCGDRYTLETNGFSLGSYEMRCRIMKPDPPPRKTSVDVRLVEMVL